MQTLNEFEYTVREIIFGNNDVFKIELNWCQDLTQLVEFVRKLEFELLYAKIKIKEQILILNQDKYEWVIKINRKEEKKTEINN